ncbi:hypothetical protein [Pedobacter sp. R-06]|uniref:hypothetical protein n=1 Tax=Pedobacter sp. R-06 TaxID=3404051 RepID=UPI003CEBF0B8
MKKGIPITELSVQELYKKKQGLQGVLIGLSLVLLAAFVIILYLAFSSRMPKVLVIVPVCCSLTFLPAFISLGQINTEIKNRDFKK